MAAGLPVGYAIPESDDELLDECDATYFQASGPGGQHRNRNRTAVRLKHRPSGLMVVATRRRSQRQNRLDALGRLRGRLEAVFHRPRPRRPSQRTQTSRERRLSQKRRRSEIKRDRGTVAPDER
jgi:protein subunit release factor A